MGVGVGAGGLESLTALLRSLPADAGVALLIVAHIPEGMLAALVTTLARATTMPVAPVTHGAAIEPNHVYIAPPRAEVTRDKRRFELSHPASPSPHAPIDVSFRSLAEARRDLAIGVILSGLGSDGALGIMAIKAGGGITFAEDIRSAKHESMPQHAVGSGYVDFMMPPAEIGARIADIAARVRAADAAITAESDREELARVLRWRVPGPVDFALYRRPALRRTTARRMAIARVETLAAYLDLVEARPMEAGALLRGLLVRTTRFFRDPEAFGVLQRAVWPALFSARPRDVPLRIWVAGCSTGEEVYSIAIALLETASDLGTTVPFQIFGTDVCEDSLERARTGTYFENIALDVSPARLQRFFTRSGTHYQVARSIREACVFARHDVMRDPPLTRMDLVSLRHVLTYFDPEPAARVVPSLHYALRPEGYLLLGASDDLAGHGELFETVDAAAAIHMKPPAAGSVKREITSPRPARGASVEIDPPFVEPTGQERHLDLLLEELQATNEELQATNEELLSSNEELQSINEELNATKADLVTANAALARRNEELTGLADDLSNLIASVSLPMIIVDRERRIRRFTPQAGRSLNLLHTDVGRPLGEIDLDLDAQKLDNIVADVIDALSMREEEVQDRRGRWHAMRVRPYVTADHRIDGAVLLLLEVDRMRRAMADRALPEG